MSYVQNMGRAKGNSSRASEGSLVFGARRRSSSAEQDPAAEERSSAPLDSAVMPAAVVKDRFDAVLGTQRGSAGRAQLVAIAPALSGAGRVELERLLDEFDAGEHQRAFKALQAHHQSVNDRPGLTELLNTMSARLTDPAFKEHHLREQSFFTSTQLLPAEALCVVKDHNSVLHLWAEGEQFPCEREPSLSSITCVCEETIPLTDHRPPRVPLGAWRAARIDEMLCQDCSASATQFPVCFVRKHRPLLPRALTSQYKALLTEHLQARLLDGAATSPDSQQWIPEAMDKAVSGALLSMTGRMAAMKPYGERALLRVLGREDYDRQRETLAARGHDGLLSELIPTATWIRAASYMLPAYMPPDEAAPHPDAPKRMRSDLAAALDEAADYTQDRDTQDRSAQ